MPGTDHNIKLQEYSQPVYHRDYVRLPGTPPAEDRVPVLLLLPQVVGSRPRTPSPYSRTWRRKMRRSAQFDTNSPVLALARRKRPRTRLRTRSRAPGGLPGLESRKTLPDRHPGDFSTELASKPVFLCRIRSRRRGKNTGALERVRMTRPERDSVRRRYTTWRIAPGTNDRVLQGPEPENARGSRLGTHPPRRRGNGDRRPCVRASLRILKSRRGRAPLRRTLALPETPEFVPSNGRVFCGARAVPAYVFRPLARPQRECWSVHVFYWVVGSRSWNAHLLDARQRPSRDPECRRASQPQLDRGFL